MGESVIRIDAQPKAAGETRYTDDLPFDGLHGVILRSTEAAAEILEIRFDPAYDFSACTVVTAREIPGRNVFALLEEDQPFLAEKEVRFVGEPILLLAHPVRERAREALRHIEVRYRPKEPVLSMEEALAGKRIIYKTDNCFARIEVEKGEVPPEEGYGVLEKEYRTPHQEHLYLEPQSMIAYNRGGRIKVLGSMQCPFDAAKALRELMGEEVEVEQAPTGGGFGGKEDYPSLMAAWACLLSRKSGQDVKLVLDRMEDFAFSTKRHPARMRYRSRFDDTGRVRSLEVDLTIDGGAYATLSAEVLARAVLHCTGFYDIPHIRVRARAVATNTPPNTSFRGFGAPQAIFGIERHMDDIARVVGISPAELRARNLPDESTRTLTGVPVPHAAALRRLFERARAESAFDEKYAAKSPGRGIGMALFMHGGGYLGNGETEMAPEGWLYLSEEGIAEIRVGSVEMGQGSMTALMQIVARELGVGLERIRYHRPDTARVADSGPTVASRTVMIVGGLLAEAARSLRRALEPYGGSKEFASAARAYLRAGGTAKFAAKYRPPALPVWDEERFRGQGYPDYSLGCYVAEVSVDPVDYRVRVERLYAANDVGEVVNPLMAEGQVEGGALQGIGYALSERLVREKGLLRNRTLSDYGTPMAPDAPREMTVRFLGEERPSCGLGELPMNGPAPAVVNAICHALGREFDAIPVTPEVIEEVSDVD